ncbi:Ribocuclease J [Desulfococcus multivorans DSM 2059]|uniref:Ribonuclease J n=2 Tax=Desulfococcus multivorans TaxID=897 RepID=S7TQL7_DESML|nr:Ribocuclease J [Desulfococcus multivorans DSM 2059]SKA11658.1 ribonuclease J [Desulfococcus multivorans DSM 2059]
MQDAMLKIIPIGGLGEIGLNMMVVEYQGDLLVIDAGLMFPEDYMLGVDLVIPDMEFIRRNKSRVVGVLLTHAHEDHIGALSYLMRDVNVPVYGTPFTLGVVRHKLDEIGLLGQADLREVQPGLRLVVGKFEIDLIRVGHSVVDGIGLAIRTPMGLVVHTGDFKISHAAIDGMTTDVNKFARCGEEGVLALLSDSTNVEKEGYTISDREIGETLKGIISKCRGRVIVALFASSISRIQQIIDIAHQNGRQVVYNGRSIEVTVGIAKSLGYIRIPDGMEIGIDEIGNIPDDQVVLITTGSQGEPMSALARMATGIHKQIKIRYGDMVILSSKFIPGNEKAIGKIINNLYRRGADVIYEKISAIHVSGHAFREELKLMINLTRPRYFIPIHGEYRHLVLHARLAEEMGIPKNRVMLAENGQVIEFDAGGCRISSMIQTGRILVDGKGIGDVGRSLLKERRVLSEDGFVAVTLAFDEETGIVMYGPEVISRGFVFETETGHLVDDAQCVILEAIEDIGPDVPDRIEKIRARIKGDLRKYFNYTIKRRPLILPFVLEI